MSEHGRLIYTLGDIPERGIYTFESLPDTQKNFPAVKILRRTPGKTDHGGSALVYVRYYRSIVEAITDFNWDPNSGSPAEGTSWFAYNELHALSSNGFFNGRLRLISDDTDGIAV